MLAYFPQVHSDELLYSVLARYRCHVGKLGSAPVLEKLFGNRKVIAAFDLPGHLQALANQIPQDRNLGLDKIIDSLTLYRYYTAFQPPRVGKVVRDVMASGCIDGLHVRLGLSAFRVKGNQHFHFCPECTQAMQTQHGELWWRRDHQLPGVMVCPEHGCLLRRSTVAFSQLSRHEFIAANHQNCPSHAKPVYPVFDHVCLSHLHRIARLLADLLVHQSKVRTPAGWTLFYRSQMQDAGLSKSSSTMDQQLLESEFRDFYGNALHVLPHVMDGGNFAGDWLTSMVRKHRKANHPLYHVLLQDFLFQRGYRVSPFGKGPWPCRNPLATHRSKTPIETITLHKNHGNSVGVFACSCGYVYTRCLSSHSGEIGSPRFLRFGPLLEPELRKMIDSGAGLRDIGRSLSLDPKTIVRLAGELHIEIPWICGKTIDAPSLVKTATPQNNRMVSPVVTSIAVDTPVSYPLPSAQRCSTPKTPVKAARRSRIDWNALDSEWVKKLTKSIESILLEDPPVRITMAEVERREGKRGWLFRRRHLMLQASEILDRCIETTHEFQTRRINWAIEELEISGAPVRAWQVMRKAGLNSSHLEQIKATLGASPPTARKTA